MPSLILRIYILCECGFFVHLTLYFFALKNLLIVVVGYFKCALIFKEFKETRCKEVEHISIEEKVQSKKMLAKNKVDILEIPESDCNQTVEDLEQQNKRVDEDLDEMTSKEEV